MNTNKTVLAINDNSTNRPIQILLKLEFDIYEDAIDYVESYLKDTAAYYAASIVIIYLYSYDFTSYRYVSDAGTIVKSATAFPNLIS